MEAVSLGVLELALGGLAVLVLGVILGAVLARPGRTRANAAEDTCNSGADSSAPGGEGTDRMVVARALMLPATAYRALSDLTGCRGVLVVESGRVLCVTSDEEASVVWPRDGGGGDGG